MLAEGEYGVDQNPNHPGFVATGASTLNQRYFYSRRSMSFHRVADFDEPFLDTTGNTPRMVQVVRLEAPATGFPIQQFVTRAAYDPYQPNPANWPYQRAPLANNPSSIRIYYPVIIFDGLQEVY